MANRELDTNLQHEFSNNTMINGGSFVTVGEGGVFQAHTHFPTIGGSIGMMDKLAKVMAPGAFHNSAERYDPPKCHPKTREAVLKKIMDWVQGLGESERHCYFMWLYGPAGAGKSAIAQTIAELCYELKFLAASFFFSRTAAGRNDHSRLIATLTYQLCLSIPEIRIYVEDAVQLDPNVFSLSLDNQVRKLIIEPLSHLHNNVNQCNGRIHPTLFIIDGLDECTSAIHVQCHVLRVLAEKLPIPMLFLVASRPEPDIRGFFTAEPMASITTTLALDNSYLPDADIKVFLEAKFNAIKRRHPLSHHLPDPWPSTSDVDHLVCKASGQFIYASTVMKYVESPRHWPTDRLKTILGIMRHGEDTPFADLDALYTQILSSVEDINKVLEVFAVLLFIDRPKSLALIEALLGFRYGDLNITLVDLHSILDILPQGHKGEVRILHASLGDFLLDQTRAGIYYINPGHAHANLACHFIRYITQKGTDNEAPLLHKLSSDSFTEHCTLSYPTAELLDALWNLDTFSFWTHFYKRVTSEGFKFVTWLKNNGSIKEGQDLYSHYMDGWSLCIRNFSHLLSPCLRDNELFFLFILHSFDKEYPTEAYINGLKHQRLSWLCYVGIFHRASLFFSDPSHSGPFYLDGDKYAIFSIKFTKYLIAEISSRPKLYFEVGRHLSSLSVLLSKASYSIELASLLNSGLLRVIEAGHGPDLLHQAANIVKMYCNGSSPRHYAALYTENSDAFESNGAVQPSTADSSMYTFKSFPEPAAIPEANKGRHKSVLTPAHPKIRKTQEAPITKIRITRYKRARKSLEKNGDASPAKRSLRSKLNIEASSASASRTRPSIRDSILSVTALPPASTPATSIMASHHITSRHPIPTLARNSHINEPHTPPNEYAGLMNMTLLPVPPGGFPLIQGLTNMDMRACVSPNSLALWERYQGAAVLAYIPHDKPEAESSPKVMKVQNLIQSVFNPPGLIVSAPQYIDAVDSTKKPIYPFFIGGISNDQAQLLLDRICWSTPTITFFTAPFTSFVSSFAMTLQNIPLASTHENELAIARVVRDTIRTNAMLYQWLTRHHEALPNYPTTDEVIKHIFDSVRATALNAIVAGEPVTLFNIFATPPSRDSATCEDWANQLRNITYFSEWGTHTAKEPYSCDCCKSTDHPVELCPFQAIPGFPVPPQLSTTN